MRILLITGVLLSMSANAATHQDLVELFAEWRSFEQPPEHHGAPDYRTETFAARREGFEALRARHQAMVIDEWSREHQVDWHILRAELNGYDFNDRILRPWQRDPAFYKSIWTYKSDVPAHEGPTHHAVVEWWTYETPLSESEQERLTRELGVIPPLMAQARQNLTGNARDLWVAGIRDLRRDGSTLITIGEAARESGNAALMDAVSAAQAASEEFVEWLEQQAPSKDGPSGLGKDNYTWYQQNVHLVPLTWDDEVRLLTRELDRAWSNLKLEEHRNRNLPPLESAETPEAYAALADRAATQLIDFLRDNEVVTVPDYFEPALRAKLGTFVPKETRHFFYIASHYDPRPLFSHFYHWFELARMEHEPHPSPLRGASLYNIFDSRNEGTATAVEEIFMHAGLYDESPRVREIVWIMLAQRAARGLGSLYAHANEMTMEEAGQIHQDWTPRGWMKTERELLIFEQHLYLRQPGYGTSYVTGKYLLERTMSDFAKQREDAGEPFVLKDFFDELNRIDSIPIMLGRYEMTGLPFEPGSIELR